MRFSPYFEICWQNMKIGFYASYTFILENYWEYLRTEADCWWVVTNPRTYSELKKKNIKKIVFCPCIIKQFSPRLVRKVMSWILDLSFRELPIKLIYKILKIVNSLRLKEPDIGRMDQALMDKVSPDMWITDTTLRLVRTSKKAPWIQTFHSVPFKKYFFNPEILNYDLLLLPGEYHKREVIKRFNVKDESCLKVVGWPRVDDFFNGVYDREKIMSQLSLDPKLRTVMYAPTSNFLGEASLFPKSFGCNSEVFENLCSQIRKMGLNFVIKLHSETGKIIKDKDLHKICKRYNVLWVTKELDDFIETPNPYLWVTDILVSDLSGIITDFMVLNRPIVFIEPDESSNCWEESDLPKSFRSGHVVKSMKELLEAIEDSLKFPNRYENERNKVVSEIFYNLDGKASERATEAIIEFARKI